MKSSYPLSFLVLFFILLSTLSIHGEEVPKENICRTDSLVITTGWDRTVDTSEIWNHADPHWRVVDIEVDPMPTSLETGQAEIVPYARMVPIGGSRWINGSSEINYTAKGVWAYETIVCTERLAKEVVFVCDLLAATETTILFNGVELGRTGPNGADHRIPYHLEADLTPYITTGHNKLRVEVNGLEESFMGFDLVGYVRAASEGEGKVFSCDGCGQIVPATEPR